MERTLARPPNRLSDSTVGVGFLAVDGAKICAGLSGSDQRNLGPEQTILHPHVFDRNRLCRLEPLVGFTHGFWVPDRLQFAFQNKNPFLPVT